MRNAAMLLALAFPLAAQEPTPFVREEVRSLLRTRLPCLGCHELDGQGGHVGPSLTDVGRRRNAGYIRAIIEDPQRVVSGAAMPLTPMSPATRDALIRVLSIGAPPGSPPVPRPPAVRRPPANGANLYGKWCAACHGHMGGGDGENARYLPVRPAVHSSAAAMSARPDDALFDVIAAGGLAMGKSARMPAFGASLTTAEIRALVAYIRTLCRCQGPAWSRDGSSP